MKRKTKVTKFWQTSKFKSLQKKWDDKLRSSGFQDAEKTIDGEKYLKFDQEYTNADNRWEYFDQLEKKSLDAVYDSELERIILNRLIAGISQTQLIEDLYQEGIKPRTGKKFSRNTIRNILRKYVTRWGIRSWKKNPTV
jgi:histone acetyltransferase (RNA polymerase elongator complex component)